MKAREAKGDRGFECVDARTRVIKTNILKRHGIQKICLANHSLITTLPAKEWQQKSYELLLTFIGVFELLGKSINQFLLRLNIRLTVLFRLGWQQVNEKESSEFKTTGNHATISQKVLWQFLENKQSEPTRSHHSLRH